MLLLKGDHRDVGCVAFVSSPRMKSDLVQLHAQLSTYWMCGVTNPSDTSVDSIATVSFADLNTPCRARGDLLSEYARSVSAQH